MNRFNDIDEVLVEAQQIDQRLDVLATEIDAYYQNESDELLLVGVLTGATYVMADFTRKLEIDAPIDWMSLSSYGSGTKSSGVVRILKDLLTDVEGKHVLIVEDIIDSGLTLSWLVQNLRRRGAKSVEIITLLLKKRTDIGSLEQRRQFSAKWVGFEIPDKFVVGYGLDYNGNYRTLPYVGVLKPEVYT